MWYTSTNVLYIKFHSRHVSMFHCTMLTACNNYTEWDNSEDNCTYNPLCALSKRIKTFYACTVQ